MAEQEFAQLSDTPLSAAMLGIAAQWATERHPYYGEHSEKLLELFDRRTQVMLIALQRLEAAIRRVPPHESEIG